jgi:hypothetical protein
VGCEWWGDTTCGNQGELFLPISNSKLTFQGPLGVANEKAKQVFYNDVPDILATYLLCENDNCVPLSVQEGNVAATPGMQTERIGSGHSPMLS